MSSLQVLKEAILLLLLNMLIAILFLLAWAFQNPSPTEFVIGKII